MSLLARVRALFVRPKKPTLRDLTRTVTMSAEQLNAEMRELAQCECVDAVSKVMGRARRQKAGH